MADYKVWECIICGYIYDEAQGDPSGGIAAGTRWEDIPADWLCPECGVAKDDFEMVERNPVANIVNLDTQPISALVINDTADEGGSFEIWECAICGWQYDESKGLPEEGFPPGTRWQDIPDDWLCPDCGVGKSDFEMVAIAEVPANEHPQMNQLKISLDQSLEPIVIIGAGLAGYTLAKQYRRLNQTRPIVMVTADEGTFYSKPALSTGYQKNKTVLGLVNKEAETMATELALDLRIFCHIESINPSTNTVTIGKENLRYHKLVLATGSQCINPPIQGNAADKVLNINNLNDYARFRTSAVNKQRITIIGAGLIGSEFCNDMGLAGFEIDIVDPLPHMLASLIPSAAAKRLENAYTNQAINFHFGKTVDAVNHANRQLEVTLSNHEKIYSDLVLSAVGVRANTTLAESCGLEVNRGIITDSYCQTSKTDIYAIGDCAEVNGQLLFYISPLNECANALAQTLNGNATEVNYDIMPIIIKTSAHPVTVVPAPRDAKGEWQIDHDESHGVAARFVDDSGRVIGFTLTGDQNSQKDRYVDMCR